jgi:PAS domain S-box-containing protein
VADPEEFGEVGEIGETQILAALLGIADMVGGLTDTEEIVALIARVTPGVIRVDRCAIMGYDEANREFRTLGSFCAGSRGTPFDGLRIPESDIPWLSQRLMALRLPAFLKATAGEVGLSPSLQQRIAVKSALVVPLAARGRFLGLLWLDDTRTPHYFTSEEINIAQGIGAQVAIALDRANLADQLDLERRRSEALVSALFEGLIVVDGDGRILTIDPGAESLIGWQTSEVRGRQMREVFDISEGEASVAWRMDTSGPSSRPKPLALRARDGEVVVCWALGIAVRNAAGETVQVLYLLRKRTGASGYWERVIDSMDDLADAQSAEPPE